MHKSLFITLMLFLLALPLAYAAYESRYFSVKDSTSPYSALPGEEVVVTFTLSNRDLLCPYNVTAYFDPCPVGWECEEKLFCYDDDGNYEENLTIKLPSTASPKKYTTYILLKGDYRTRRGNDRILLTVLTEEQAATVDYTKPIVQEPVEEPVEQAVEEVAAEIESVPEPEPVEEIPEIEQPPMPEENKSQLMEDVERLESNKGFMEYVSVVLVVLLVFVAAGAYITFKKEK